jgi:hypothetical protein
VAANESLRFDITANDRASDAFSKFGRSVSDVSAKMDGATARSIFLDDALKRQAETAKRSTDATLKLAASDKILDEVERRLADGALEAEFALKREADAKKKSGDAAVTAAAKNKTFADSLSNIANKTRSGGGPAWLGPALLAAGPLSSVAGVAAGATLGIAGAAVAGAGALAAFGAVAKPVLADALKASQAVNTAQNNYNVAIAAGTKQAVAYKAEQIAIGKAYAELSPQQIALSKQLGSMADAWDNLKAAETPVVAGALQPWLKSVTDLTGKLAPIIAKVSPVIRDLGTQFDHLVNSAAFKGFRDFVANTGSKVVGAVGSTLIDFVKALMILLPKFNPLIMTMTGGIAALGPAVLKWASSKKTADDITKFMDWFHANGPAVGHLLASIGGALKALAPGLGPASITELNIISGFFGLIAKLPAAVAKPLLEVAGALLILNKLGVISVGVKIVGAAAKWLTGGVAELGGGAAAGAEIRAAMVSGGVAAGAEIRAAMAGGAAADGAAVGGGEAVAMKGAAPAIGTLIGLAVAAQVGGFLAYRQFSNLFSSGVKGSSAAGQFGSSGQSAPLGAVLAGTGTNTAAKLTADLAPANALLKSLGYSQYAIGLINKAILKPGSDVGKVDALIYQLGGTQADILAVNKLIVKPGSDAVNIDSLLKKIGLTPPQIASVNKLKLKPGDDQSNVDAMLKKIGLTPPQIASVNRMILKPHSDTSPVSALQRAIDSLHGKTVNVLMHAAGSGSIYFNETTGVGGSVTGGLKFMARGGTGPALAVVGEQGPELVSLPPGARVYSHGQSAAMIPGIPGFAAGGYVPNYAGAVNWMGGSEYGFGKSVENSYAVRLIAQLKAAVQKAATAVNTGGVYLGPGSGNYAADITTVLRQLGLPLSLVGNWLTQIQTESGGNLGAVNRTDSNWLAGHPSVGLLQLIPSTFAAFAGPYRNTPPLVNYGGGTVSENPMAQIYAAIRYAATRYDGAAMASVIGHGHGYDQGGYLPPGLSLAWNGTGRPEPVGPAAGSTYNITVNVPPTVNPKDAGRQVAALLGAHIKSGGRIYPAGVTPR